MRCRRTEGVCHVGRMGAAIVGMELAALIVAVLAFGWPVLLVGAPLLVCTLVALAVVRLWELVRRRLDRQLAAAGISPRPCRMA